MLQFDNCSPAGVKVQQICHRLRKGIPLYVGELEKDHLNSQGDFSVAVLC